MKPETARLMAAAATGIGTVSVWRWLDPEGWRPFGAILAYLWVILPAFLAYIMIQVLLMEFFGQRTKYGTVEEYLNPVGQRLDAIEAAINRLYDYVQEIDPELE